MKSGLASRTGSLYNCKLDVKEELKLLLVFFFAYTTFNLFHVLFSRSCKVQILVIQTSRRDMHEHALIFLVLMMKNSRKSTIS